MINIDTNVLVRAYLEDDEKQAQEAQSILLRNTGRNSLFVSSYAILEFAWVLKVKSISRVKIHQAITTLVNSTGVITGQKDVVLRALEKYVVGKADFGDYMILAEGKKNGAHQIKTFDKEFRKELD